jgi:hypothetical protein
MKFLRLFAGYTLHDQKTNKEISEKVNIYIYNLIASVAAYR